MVKLVDESWVGRKVKCVDAKHSPFKTGGIYVVVGENLQYLRIKGRPDYQLYMKSRFELLPQEHPQEDAFEVPSMEPVKAPPSDAVNRPAHYARFKIEPIHFIMENKLEFWQGNVIKYTLRWDGKDGLQDLKKARRYLDMQIKKMEGDPKWSE